MVIDERATCPFPDWPAGGGAWGFRFADQVIVSAFYFPSLAIFHLKKNIPEAGHWPAPSGAINSNKHAQRYKHQNWIAWGVAWADPLSTSLLIGRFSGQILVARLRLINLGSSLSGHPPGHGTTLDLTVFLLSICLFITHPFIAFNYCKDAVSAKNQSALLNWKQLITCRVNTSGV